MNRKSLMITAYIALGSNLNNPRTQVEMAITAIKSLPSTDFLIHSKFYHTKPWGFLQQPDFINAVCAIKTGLSPQELLTHLHYIEKAQGRVRNGEKNQPRHLDLDILLYGDVILNEADLVIPHPRMCEREFVLMPLAEIASNIRLPNQNTSIKDLLAKLTAQA